MNLFLDTVSPQNVLILFNNNKKIIKKYFFDVRLNESTKLIEELDIFLKSNNINYSQLENLVVVNWPGSFTGIRTTVLIINTINFIINKNITRINYFDLFEDYPIIKVSSKRDSFLKISKNNEIEIFQNLELENILNKKNIDKIFWDAPLFNNITINNVIDYEKIILNIIFDNKKIISPFYIKKPTIS